MTLEQDIQFLEMSNFNSIQEMNNHQIIQKYFITTCNGGIDHIFKGFQPENGIFSGYHTEILYPNLYHPVFEKLNTNKNSVYQMFLSDVNKLSTFFPLTMTCSDIVIATLLAYKDIKQKIIINPNATEHKHNCYIKKYGISIMIIMDRNFKIYNAFPIK